MKLQRLTVFSFTLLFVLGVVFLPFHFVSADQYGLDATARQSGLLKTGAPQDVPTIAGNIIGTALSMISVIFFILMVYGGFLWMTAHGDEGQVKKAQDTIIAAVIGIIVILASYAITKYVTTSVISSEQGSPSPAPASPEQPLPEVPNLQL